MELAIIAARSGCNVAFFSIGDMTKTQMARRFHMRLTGKNPKASQCGKARKPVLDCWQNQTGDCEFPERPSDVVVREQNEDTGKWELSDFDEAKAAGYLPCAHCRKHDPEQYRGAFWWEDVDIERLTVKDAFRAARDFDRRYGDRIRMKTYGAGEINVKGIDHDLEVLKEEEEFTADVVIIDYGDVLGPEDSKRTEERHKQNDNWMALSALRQKWRNLVFVPTQTDAASYDVRDITLKNFSEDKRKFAHVTAMIAINQTPKEKEQGVARIGLVIAREADFAVSSQARILQCLRMGKPLIGSF
jgi:hypothetical protein